MTRPIKRSQGMIITCIKEKIETKHVRNETEENDGGG